MLSRVFSPHLLHYNEGIRNHNNRFLTEKRVEAFDIQQYDMPPKPAVSSLKNMLSIRALKTASIGQLT